MIYKRVGLSFKRLCLALLVPAVHIFYLIQDGARNHMLILSTKIDSFFPFNSLFIVPYEIWFLFVAAGLIFFALADSKIYYQQLLSLLTGATICYLIFHFFPTTIIRPTVTGNNFFDSMVKNYYIYDCPYNCFPSIHVLYTVIITLFVCKYSRNNFVRSTIILSCIVISISTLYVKQHYFLDVLAGTFIAIILYLFFSNDYIWEKFYALKNIFPLRHLHKKKLGWVFYHDYSEERTVLNDQDPI